MTSDICLAAAAGGGGRKEEKGGGMSGAPARKRSMEGAQKSGGSVGSRDHGVEVAVGVI